jgi:DNA polymerase-3 subunit beta
LDIVSRAVATRSTLPVLGNVLLRANGDGRLRLSATDLEVGINCWIGAKVEESGAITVPAATLTDLVKVLPDGERVALTLDEETKTLDVSAPRSQSNVKGIDAEEFPAVPTPEGDDGIVIEADVLSRALDQVVFAAATDDSRPILTGVLAEFEGERLTLAAADGFRLSERVVALPEPVDDPFRVIIPASSLKELARIIDDEESVTITIRDRRQVIFHLGDVVLVTQLIEGHFVDYRGILDAHEPTTHTVMERDDFLRACKVAQVFARDANQISRLHVEPSDSDLEPGVVEVHAVSAETGQDTTTLDAAVEGEGIDIAFNVKYLIAALKVIQTPEVTLETAGPNTAAVIRPVEADEHFVHAIMPMDLEKRGGKGAK